MAEQAAVHGVLVTYRRPAALGATLERLAQQERRLDSLVVVDNDPEESARLAAEAYTGAGSTVYLAAGRNLGPAGGIALGMRHVLEHARDSDWIVLLDDDDPPRTREHLRMLTEFGTRLREQDARLGGVGASGTRFDMARGRTCRIPDRDLVGAVPSACIGGNQLPTYSVSAVRAVGVFDEQLFFGLDDLEFGLRLWAAGFHVFAHGDLWRRDREHYRRTGIETPPQRALAEPGWRRYYSLRNLIVILRRHGHRTAAARLAVRSLAKPIYNVPRAPHLAAAHLSLNARAIRDAYAGRMGLTVQPQPKA